MRRWFLRPSQEPPPHPQRVFYTEQKRYVNQFYLHQTRYADSPAGPSGEVCPDAGLRALGGSDFQCLVCAGRLYWRLALLSRGPTELDGDQTDLDFRALSLLYPGGGELFLFWRSGCAGRGHGSRACALFCALAETHNPFSFCCAQFAAYER